MDELIFRIAIIGEVLAGKTSLISRFMTGKFKSDTKSTIGVDFALKHVPIHLDKKDYIIVLQIWDIAGESRFRNTIPLYIPGVNGIILVFDSMKSLDALHQWIDVIKSSTNIHEIPILLISTKSDLNYILDKEIVKKFVKEYQIANYYSTSSLTGINVELSFKRISQLMINPSMIQ